MRHGGNSNGTVLYDSESIAGQSIIISAGNIRYGSEQEPKTTHFFFFFLFTLTSQPPQFLFFLFSSPG